MKYGMHKLFRFSAISAQTYELDSEKVQNLFPVYLRHMPDQLQNLVGIPHLIIIPCNHLHKRVGQRNACLGVEDGGTKKARNINENFDLLVFNF